MSNKSDTSLSRMAIIRRVSNTSELPPEVFMAVEVRSPSSDHAVAIAVSWDAYRALVDSLGDHSRVRLTYDGEILEIMSPGSKHERLAGLIGDLISAVRLEWEFNVEDTGSTTFQKPDELGFEADKSYYIGNAANVHDFDDINLAVDPAPDLVIEVDITSIGSNKKDVYSRVGVAEFWRYRKVQLSAFALVDGAYVDISVSRVIPGLPIAAVEMFIERSGSRLEVLQHWRQWLRENRERHEKRSI